VRCTEDSHGHGVDVGTQHATAAKQSHAAPHCARSQVVPLPPHPVLWLPQEEVAALALATTRSGVRPRGPQAACEREGAHRRRQSMAS
jgi:hypothetical protein